MIDRKIYKKLNKLKSLKPSTITNKLFYDLVSFAIDSKNIKTLNESELENLRAICSKAESEMEYFWAEKIISSKNPQGCLESFWYYKNYEELARLEYKNLLACGSKHEHKKAVFIGSGPLPLTTIILAKCYGLKFLLVDIDKNALEISKKLIKKLGLSKYFIFSSTNFEKLNLKKYNIVFLAALVGQNNKEKITEKVYSQMNKGSHLLCRSAYDNRDLLYKPLNLNCLNIKPVKEIKTYDHIINSILIFKK